MSLAPLKYVVPIRDADEEEEESISIDVVYHFPWSYQVGEAVIHLHHGDVDAGDAAPPGDADADAILACRAVEAYNLDKRLEAKAREAAVCIANGRVVRLAVLVQFDADCVRHVDPDELGAWLVRLVHDDVDICHRDIVDYSAAHQPLVSALMAYLAERTSPDASSAALLKAQRALVVLADVLWACLGTGATRSSLSELFAPLSYPEQVLPRLSQNEATRERLQGVLGQLGQPSLEYVAFVNQFLRTANELELRDYEKCAANLLTVHADVVHPPCPIEPWDEAIVHASCSGMRFALSSANASDNWTSVKLRRQGGRVFNCCVDLNGRSPVRATARWIAQRGVVVLRCGDSLDGGVFSCADDRFVLVKGQDVGANAPDPEAEARRLLDVSDVGDRFRLLKSALLFVGITCEGGAAAVARALAAVVGPEGGLEVTLTNTGPSKSGFASSSAVSTNLLYLLFRVTGRRDLVGDLVVLNSLSLLFENRAGLKSGRQDVDGLLPGGLKSLVYHPTLEDGAFVVPEVTLLEDFPFDIMHNHIVLVDTGIQRSTHMDLRRGLNMRYWCLLSRECEQGRFRALRASYGIHWCIVDALTTQDWPRLGALLLEYMRLRETIDPGATSPTLWRVFDELLGKGLICGGTLAGAMGGGVAIVIVQDAKHLEPLDKALEELREWRDGDAQPLKHIRRLDYSADVGGVRYCREEAEKDDA